MKYACSQPVLLNLDGIKQKAKQMGIPYQTFVSELIHQYAV